MSRHGLLEYLHLLEVMPPLMLCGFFDRLCEGSDESLNLTWQILVCPRAQVNSHTIFIKFIRYGNNITNQYQFCFGGNRSVQFPARHDCI